MTFSHVPDILSSLIPSYDVCSAQFLGVDKERRGNDHTPVAPCTRASPCDIHLVDQPVMKVVLQRCLSASVTVDSNVVSAIGKGILVLAGIGPDDTKKDVESMASKIVKMKLWPDEDGKMWKNSVADIDGEILCVSQFTLYASTKKGNKPDFHGAAGADMAKSLYDYFFQRVQQAHQVSKVKDGIFQAMMEVALVNDGPVTIQMENGASKRADISGSTTEPSE